MTAWLAATITALIAAGGYAGIAFWMALESACLPIPSELVMPFAGYLAGTGRFSLAGVALAGAIGCNLGSIAGYSIGFHGGRAFVRRYGRYLLMGEGELASAERFYARFGVAATFFGRLLPVVRTFIAVPAGMARMRQVPFHAFTFAGSFLWCLVLAWIGRLLGKAWDSNPALAHWLHALDGVAVVLIAGAVAAFVWMRLRR